jgi:hypothetical protein
LTADGSTIYFSSVVWATDSNPINTYRLYELNTSAGSPSVIGEWTNTSDTGIDPLIVNVAQDGSAIAFATGYYGVATQLFSPYNFPSASGDEPQVLAAAGDTNVTVIVGSTPESEYLVTPTSVSPLVSIGGTPCLMPTALFQDDNFLSNNGRYYVCSTSETTGSPTYLVDSSDGAYRQIGAADPGWVRWISDEGSVMYDSASGNGSLVVASPFN